MLYGSQEKWSQAGDISLKAGNTSIKAGNSASQVGTYKTANNFIPQIHLVNFLQQWAVG